MARVIILSALSFGGLSLLCFFVYRMVRDIGAGRALGGYALKLGAPAAVVLLSLALQRLLPLAAGFLIGLLLVLAALFLYARLSGRTARADRGPTVLFRLVELDKYARHIRERAVLRRVLRLASLVESIRSVAGYDQKTLIDQNADILRMENIYLPRIESLVGQYIKIASHDSGYDSRRLMEQLDALTGGIQKIQAERLCRDKMNIDAEASALISAMELDGYGEEKDLKAERGDE